MKVLIVEDEIVAANRLEKMLMEYDSEIEIIDKIDSVLGTVEFLSEPSVEPDVIFMDIQLGDGLSFEIFETINVDYPIIFTTAFNEYAINAFKVNSIDYLLKPISQSDIDQSLEKLKKYGYSKEDTNAPKDNIPDLSQVLRNMLQDADNPNYKNRFLVKYARGFKSIVSENIAYLYSEDKITFMVTTTNEKYILDYSLEDVSNLLNPKHFFKISRQFIVAMNNIEDIQNHFNSRLILKLTPHTDKEVFVSRSQVGPFKEWLDN